MKRAIQRDNELRSAGREAADIYAVLWSGRRLIIAAIVIAVAFGITYLHFATKKYETTLSVAETERQETSGGLSGLLESQTGLSGLLPRNRGAYFKLYLEALYLPVVAQNLAKDPALMHWVFQDNWDAHAQRWRVPSGLKVEILSWIKSVLDYPSGSPVPNAQMLNKYIVDDVTVSQDPRRQIVTIGLASKDRAQAANFLWKLHLATDSYLKEMTLDRANSFVQYLNNKLSTVTIADYRQALINALVAQERMRMMASSNLSFAADALGPPTSSPRPVRPNIPLVLAVSALIGAVIGAVLLMLQARRDVFVNDDFARAAHQRPMPVETESSS